MNEILKGGGAIVENEEHVSFWVIDGSSRATDWCPR